MDWKKGVSLSMYQNAGEQEFETNWTEQVRRKKKQSAFPNANDVIGKSSDFWNRCDPRLSQNTCLVLMQGVVPLSL
jgi:hypothetical protein